MRPRGEIRQALATAAEQLVQEREAFTWRELAEVAQVGQAAARRTVENMAAWGELQRLPDTKRVPGVCRPLRLYTTSRRDSWVAQGADLANVFNGWRRRD
jgi:response regulator of citrate/malate metabolism